MERILYIRRMPGLTLEERLCLVSLDKKDVFALNKIRLASVLGRPLPASYSFLEPDLPFYQKQARSIELLGIKTLLWGDDDYPPLLKEIYDPPFTLFYRGSLPKGPCISIVGSRTSHKRALFKTREVAFDLARAGVSIVSGLALGVDSAAHAGALQTGGKTFSIIATAIDTIYPKINRALASSILKSGGGIISEYPPLEPLLGRYIFPKRNRIISGLTPACLITYAPEKSGALITGQLALDQGRDVLCWNDPQSGGGVLQFLEEGAMPFDRVEDLAYLFPLLNLRSQKENQGVSLPSDFDRHQGEKDTYTIAARLVDEIKAEK